MRISDWSSDVCSSDLHGGNRCAPGPRGVDRLRSPRDDRAADEQAFARKARAQRDHRQGQESLRPAHRDRCRLSRSEEHTSELQSLMRISYAVFCLKKKNTKNNTTITACHRTNAAQ